MNPGFYTYLHCKPDGTPFYVGKGKGYRGYWLGDAAKRNPHHKRIVAKYGRKNIGIFVFPCASEAQAFEDEVRWIRQLRDEGYELANLTDGGEGMSGFSVSEETKLKISKAHIGKEKTSEHLAKIAEALRGRIRSAQHCASISKGLTGKKLSPEHKAKIGAASKGNQWNVGKTQSAESNAKRSTALLGGRHADSFESRLTSDIRKQLIDDYMSGKSLPTLETIYKTSHRAIKRVLMASGVSIRASHVTVKSASQAALRDGIP